MSPGETPAEVEDHPARAPAVIGVVGGVGPLAGLDLQAKIISETVAARDQDYLPVLSVSWPARIPDRTDFLLGRIADNPAFPILNQLSLLAEMGATVAGIPCNTAHAPAIFDVVRDGIQGFPRPLRVLHMIEETVAHLKTGHNDLHPIGVLSTTGTWRARVYPDLLEPRGLRVLVPDAALQEAIHAAVYDPVYGIKSTGQVTRQARALLEQGILALRERGARAVILGCTEMPPAFIERAWGGLPLIDPTRILARALIRETSPGQLMEWEDG